MKKEKLSDLNYQRLDKTALSALKGGLTLNIEIESETYISVGSEGNLLKMEDMKRVRAGGR